MILRDVIRERASSLQRTLRRVDSRLVDAALALVVLLATLAPLARIGEYDCLCEPVPAWAYALVLLIAAPLAWRRRAPVLVWLTTGVTTAVYGISDLPDPPVPFAALLAVYTVAAYTTRRTALVCAAVTAVVVLLALVTSDADVLDYAFIAVTITTAWTLGDSVRSRRAYTRVLEARAEQLEREQ